MPNLQEVRAERTYRDLKCPPGRGYRSVKWQECSSTTKRTQKTSFVFTSVVTLSHQITTTASLAGILDTLQFGP